MTLSPTAPSWTLTCCWSCNTSVNTGQYTGSYQIPVFIFHSTWICHVPRHWCYWSECGKEHSGTVSDLLTLFIAAPPKDGINSCAKTRLGRSKGVLETKRDNEEIVPKKGAISVVLSSIYIRLLQMSDKLVTMLTDDTPRPASVVVLATTDVDIKNKLCSCPC